MGSRTGQAVARVRGYTLCQLENCFGKWLPQDLFPKACQKANSRDRHYTRWRTFWCSLWQNLNPQASCRAVVRQLQALFKLEGGPQISEEDGAYCRAKARLPLVQFPKALAATAKFCDQLVLALDFLKGRPVKVVDGSALTLLADTKKNRAAYPPIQCQPNQPSFPMMRFVVLFSLLSGAILAAAQGSLVISELSLLAQLTGQLAKGDILIGDRGFGSYPVITLLQHTLGVDFIGQYHPPNRRSTTTQAPGSQRLAHPMEKGKHPIALDEPGAMEVAAGHADSARDQGLTLSKGLPGSPSHRRHNLAGSRRVSRSANPLRLLAPVAFGNVSG
jgi:hypothetical protein